jgi:rare lipoprotein A
MSKLSTTVRLLCCGVVAAVLVQSLAAPVFAHSAATPPLKVADIVSTPVAPKPIVLMAKPATLAVATTKPKFVQRVATRLQGIASWYGRALHGHPTASGEIFDETALTACHRTLPFGTMVKVENLRNHQTVVVRITDRGVLNPERVIDLSSAAAEEIGMLRTGVAPVKLTVVQQ